MQEEILTAKRILRDKNLTTLANTRFHSVVDAENTNKFLCEGAVLTELLDNAQKDLETFEVEVPKPNAKNMYRGQEMINNSDMPLNMLSLKN